MMLIKVKNNNVMKAYKLLTRKLQDDGHFKELGEKSYYIPKGEKRRKQKAVGILREKKRQQKAEELFIKQEQRARFNNKRNKSR